MDSRDLQERIEELEELFLNDEGQIDDDLYQDLSNSEREEYEELLNLKEECEGYGWEHGIYFIKEYEFYDYCKELAHDCGMVDENSPLSNFIDWNSWANACEMDYSSVDFEGETYLFREA